MAHRYNVLWSIIIMITVEVMRVRRFREGFTTSPTFVVLVASDPRYSGSRLARH